MYHGTKLTITDCRKRLQAGYHSVYGSSKPEYADLMTWVAQMALERIANSDALYHDAEHTILVTLVGQEILRGKQICEGNVTPEDWLHCIISWLCHDIGYVKGICRQDKNGDRTYTTGPTGKTITLSPGATDASLTPYHVDRGKLFVAEYFQNFPIDINIIQTNIELTRFPVPPNPEHQATKNYPGLVRAADLIGQLADPLYLQKLPALFCEFEETGASKHLGYHHAGDLRASYPQFFWNVVYHYIQEALNYLEASQEGKQIIANLFRNVLVVERELREKANLKSDRPSESVLTELTVAC